MKINAMIKGAVGALLLSGLITLSAVSQTKPTGHREKKDTTTHRLPASKPATAPAKTPKKDDLPAAKTQEPVKPAKKN